MLVTTYESLKLYQDKFLAVEWDYVFLDEGHKIKNPDAEITIVCKQLKVLEQRHVPLVKFDLAN